MFTRKSALGVLAAATALTATPSMAQDLDLDQTFNGLYIAAVGGYTMQPADGGRSIEFDTDNNGRYGDTVRTATGLDAFRANPVTGASGFCGGFTTSTTNTGCTGDKDRAEYYGRIGFDKRYGNFVVGILAEGGRTEAQDRNTAFSTTPASYRFTRGIDWSAAARLRAGYTPNGGILFYATGGGVYANMKHRFSQNGNTTSTFAQRGGDDAWGYQVGGGVEAMVARNISVGMEYLYNNIDDSDHYVLATGGAFGAGTRMRPNYGGFETHSVRGTIGFRF